MRGRLRAFDVHVETRLFALKIAGGRKTMSAYSAVGVMKMSCTRNSSSFRIASTTRPVLGKQVRFVADDDIALSRDRAFREDRAVQLGGCA